MSTEQWLILILAVVIVVAVWWWWRRRGSTVPAPPPMPPVAPRAALPPDNLEILEGVGPKIADVLKGAGITTFAQLAATNVSTLQGILKAAGLSFTDASTWPEQAALAAAGKTGELQALQDSLKGGKRV
jgi:large subunit ribosomal protein L17